MQTARNAHRVRINNCSDTPKLRTTWSSAVGASTKASPRGHGSQNACIQAQANDAAAAMMAQRSSRSTHIPRPFPHIILRHAGRQRDKPLIVAQAIPAGVGRQPQAVLMAQSRNSLRTLFRVISLLATPQDIGNLIEQRRPRPRRPIAPRSIESIRKAPQGAQCPLSLASTGKRRRVCVAHAGK